MAKDVAGLYGGKVRKSARKKAKDDKKAAKTMTDPKIMPWAQRKK